MGDRPTLVFLPGFMTAARAYAALLAPVQQAGWQVVVPQLYPRGIPALLGRHPVEQEARRAAGLVRGHCVIGGHSRGGQAAWLAAGMAQVAGVVLIDPVDGAGRRPSGPSATTSAARFSCPCLIVGAGVGGPCAPAGVDHNRFAEVTAQAEHIVIADLGHADVLTGRARSLGRRLCGAGADPDTARADVSALILRFLDGVRPTGTARPDPS